MDMALPELSESFTKIKISKTCNPESIGYNIDSEEKFKIKTTRYKLMNIKETLEKAYNDQYDDQVFITLK